jgi:hypothetical protein
MKFLCTRQIVLGFVKKCAVSTFTPSSRSLSRQSKSEARRQKTEKYAVKCFIDEISLINEIKSESHRQAAGQPDRNNFCRVQP